MGTFIQILILATLAEALTDTVKWFFAAPDKAELRNRLIALVLGILVAVGTKLDLFFASGIPIFIPWLGTILTGVVLSRGANIVHDIIKRIQQPTTDGATFVG
jgi:hypothetical protein